MRITRIKFSGFKSFVDPTTLTLPGNLTGVVGPNGCGKSNIIDALIWVLGESSAKHLRGESMADVIFNGSNTRKPVGQATVEIVFDNTDGTIGGQYAGFGEISIKRTVSRDGVSSYFLNGARCRRKDVTQVFLGTGIGSRGYSVIEQGMISRVIEARPEELRAFLEEAAGISKYKERRRETENRMRHTDENMERLNDIREELDKQLGHLQRQAKAAERFQAYKADERAAHARLLAARWRGLDSERDGCRRLREERANELEAEVARLRELEARQAGYREAQVEATETFNRVQSAFYACSGEISRLEQSIRHAEEREQTLSGDRDDARGTLDELQRVLEDDRAQLDTVRRELADSEPRFAAARESADDAGTRLGEVENRRAQWQHEWDAFNRDHNQLAQAENAARIRLEHLASGVAETDRRKAALNDEAARHDTTDLNLKATELREAVTAGERTRAELVERRSALRGQLEQARAEAQAMGKSLHEHQIQLEEQRGRLASLKALQEAAYGDEQETIEQWFQAHGLHDVQRLAEHVHVEPGWERALEAALRIPLGALCGEDLVARLAARERVDLPPITVFDTRAPNAGSAAASTLLAAKVGGRIDLGPLLHDIHVADDDSAGHALLATLPAHALVVLPDGTLLGHGWACFPGRAAAGESILARARELNRLGAALAQHEDATAELRGRVEAAQAGIKALEQEAHELGERYERETRTFEQHRGELSRVEGELTRREARAADIRAELDRLAQRSAEHEASITQLREQQSTATSALQDHAARREVLVAARDDIQRAVDAARQAARETRESAHALELRIQSLAARRQALEDTITRNAGSFEQLEKRHAEFVQAIADLAEPRQRMAAELERALGEKLEAENAVTAARTALGELDASLAQSAAQRTAIEQAINASQQRLEQVRLDERALEVRQQELRSRFEQTEQDFDATLAGLGEDDDEAALQEQLEKIAQRIARLGPINLAAIDEYNQLAERKTYLDKQHADLTEALATLHDAIRKIDRETRTRFKETYDKVNNGLQAMFPVLIGGGHAYLEMTGDDLLETGVTVMARPPGKRNSTIHLLSGGEKALTALAFVFAIFELNPAPFCLLDEVDAPLDDANVVRLTEMLKSMAKTVQFLFVTHNKITMEIAEQLIGVTMHEPGVSRLVSVNMEEAVELAATA
ncbi:MAG: chromosome segregation protein SMC [Gammaproteobacteria bacterium]|nr:chromosome segregation protein SMC [Gammaproteobacteria bacterium]